MLGRWHFEIEGEGAETLAEPARLCFAQLAPEAPAAKIPRPGFRTGARFHRDPHRHLPALRREAEQQGDQPCEEAVGTIDVCFALQLQPVAWPVHAADCRRHPLERVAERSGEERRSVIHLHSRFSADPVGPELRLEVLQTDHADAGSGAGMVEPTIRELADHGDRRKRGDDGTVAGLSDERPACQNGPALRTAAGGRDQHSAAIGAEARKEAREELK